MSEHFVIVGGGQAAAQAVQSLRQQDFAGAITLLCDEPCLPYQRPPLSKIGTKKWEQQKDRVSRNVQELAGEVG